MPRLWDETIEAHRRAVRDATLDTTAALVAEHGLASVTMSQIAEQTGIGRATLYKYFPDVEAILVAWHERQITGHLKQLAEVRDRAAGAAERLKAVLETYALILHEHHRGDPTALLHQGGHVARARQHLSHFIGELLTDGAASGDVPALHGFGPPAGHRHLGWATAPAVAACDALIAGVARVRRRSRRRRAR